jgi:endodeoxyribonuclease rusA
MTEIVPNAGMQQWQFTIPTRNLPLLNANDRLHHYARNEKFQRIKRVAIAAITKQQIPEKLERIRVHVAIFKNSRRRFDLDNFTPTYKAIQDALVQARIVPDDNAEHITEICFRFGGYDKTNPRIEIILIHSENSNTTTN